MKINKLKKQIEQYYYKNKQHLILESIEMFEHNERDCCFDIYLANSNIFLFTIQNYKGLEIFDVYHKNYINDNPKINNLFWDGVTASYIPLYYQDTITLKTFKPITEEDVIKASWYFLRKILNLMLWNIKFESEKIELPVIEEKERIIQNEK